MFHWNSLFRPLNLNNARTHCSIYRWKELFRLLLERAVPFNAGKLRNHRPTERNPPENLKIKPPEQVIVETVAHRKKPKKNMFPYRRRKSKNTVPPPDEYFLTCWLIYSDLRPIHIDGMSKTLFHTGTTG